MSEHSTHVRAGGWLYRIGALLVLAVVAFVDIAPISAQQPPAAPPIQLPQVNRVVPKEMTLEDELITADDYDKWRKGIGQNIQPALQSKNLTDKVKESTAQKVIEESVRIRIGRMSLTANRNNLKALRTDVYRDIHTFGNKTTKEFGLKTIVKEAQKLFAGNFQVRLHALWMLSELEQTPAVPGRSPAVLYGETIPVFLSVIADSKQIEAVRITSAVCLEKVLKDSQLPLNPPSKLRIEAAKGLIPALKVAGLSGSNQRSLITALGQVGLATIPDANNTQKPDVQTALIEIISDVKRPTVARAEAVAVLGKYPMPAGAAGIDTQALSKGIVQLAVQIGTDMNAKNLSHAVGFFQMQDVYTGSHGLKNVLSGDKNIQSAYSVVLGLMKAMIPQLPPKADVPVEINVPVKLLEDGKKVGDQIKK